MKHSKASAFLILSCLALWSCHSLIDDRIPHMPVNIDLGNQGVWNSYGVVGFGDFRYFILGNGMVVPPGFPYTYNSATGFGGVLLILGQNPFSNEVEPIAYDLSCPVERQPDIRVEVDPISYEAICPDCESHYNVIERGGAPTEGPAKEMGYQLMMYQCYGSVNGGYFIRD